MGLPICPAGHLSSEYQVKRHMQKRHPSEWAAIEHEREQLEKAEERGLRKILLTNAANQVGTAEAPLYVSSNPRKKKRG